jgi:hypothetical protein
MCSPHPFPVHHLPHLPHLLPTLLATTHIRVPRCHRVTTVRGALEFWKAVGWTKSIIVRTDNRVQFVENEQSFRELLVLSKADVVVQENIMCAHHHSCVSGFTVDYSPHSFAMARSTLRSADANTTHPSPPPQHIFILHHDPIVFEGSALWVQTVRGNLLEFIESNAHELPASGRLDVCCFDEGYVCYVTDISIA